MSKTPTVKILVAYHKPSYLLKSDVFVPIHLGRAVSNMKHKDGALSSKDIKWLKKNLIGDDTGENISLKNRNYCEATAIYWAWKNYDKLGNPDYIGLMHYRRFFILNEKYEKHFKNDLDERCGVVSQENINKDTFKNIGLLSSDIEKYISNYDCLAPINADLRKTNINNIREDYGSVDGLNTQDFDTLLETTALLFPNYIPDIKRLKKSCSKHMYNMFIMKKDVFFKYCTFIFTVLSKIEKQINLESYNINGQRTLGYLAEILTTLFIYNFSRNKNSIKYLPVLYAENFLEWKNIKYVYWYLKYIEYLLINKIFKSQSCLKKLQKYHKKINTIY